MRHVLIDLSSDNHLQQPQIFGGYEGEHNETLLQVKLPKRMVDIECSGYRFDFQTSEDNKISSPLISVSELQNDSLLFYLTEQLTVAGKLLVKISAITLDKNIVSLVSKTGTAVLYIGDSTEGKTQPFHCEDLLDEQLAILRGEKGDKGDKGESGVYVGSGDMPQGYNVQIDPDGEVINMNDYATVEYVDGGINIVNKEIQGIKDKVADCNVEQGIKEVDGVSWTYEKWNSGKITCKTNVYMKGCTNITTFGENATYSYKHITMPFQFVEMPIFNLTSVGLEAVTSMGEIACSIRGYTSNGFDLQQNCKNTVENYVSVCIDGKWK